MNIGLLFGSFSPVHCGHLMIANYCLDYAALQEVWLIISPHNPIKNADALFPVNQRLQWLRNALKNYSLPIKMCDIELTMPLPSYTINTLQKLADIYPQHNFSIIMGADCLAQIEHWHCWQQIIGHKILVYPRLGADAQALCKKYEAQYVDAPIINISSTMLRRAAMQGRNLSAFVPNGTDIFELNLNSDLNLITDVLRGGGVILYPTDTVWGIGCDACNETAVRRVFEIKRRALSKNFIILAADWQMLEQYVDSIPPKIRNMLHNSAEPLTIVYPQGRGLAEGVCAQDGSVAARIPKHDFCQKIIRELGRPLVSTSANISGSVVAANLSDIEEEIKLSVDAVVDEQWEGNPSRRLSRILKIGASEEMIVIRM